MSGNVLIVLEQREGRLHAAARQLLAPAERIAQARGCSVHALLVGAQLGDLAAQVGSSLVETIHIADDAGLAHYNAEHYAQVIAQAADASGACTVLMLATSMGRDVTPRVAVKASGRLATDCTDINADGLTVTIRRPMYSGKCVGTFTLGDDALQILTVRPNSFTAPEFDIDAASATSALSFTPGASSLQTTAVERTGAGTKDVTEADIVVAGGRSLKSEDAFVMLDEMAELLDGAVGASRAAVDAGYQPHARQIGLTGKVVSPRLYIATGIDGAIQHLAGMRGSKIIVAINTRDDAPIFDVATYGCVVDQFEFLPALNDALRAMRNGN